MYDNSLFAFLLELPSSNKNLKFKLLILKKGVHVDYKEDVVIIKMANHWLQDFPKYNKDVTFKEYNKTPIDMLDY